MKAMGVILLPPSDNEKYIWLLLYTANIYSGTGDTVKNCTLDSKHSAVKHNSAALWAVIENQKYSQTRYRGSLPYADFGTWKNLEINSHWSKVQCNWNTLKNCSLSSVVYIYSVAHQTHCATILASICFISLQSTFLPMREKARQIRT